MRLWTLCFALIAVVACQSQKKPAKKTAEELSYEAALNNFKIGCTYINDRNYIEAIRYLEMAVKTEDHNFRYHHWLGLALMLNGQHDEAIAEFTTAIEINPESTDSYNNLAIIAIDRGQHDVALEHLKRVVKDSDYGQPQLAYFNLGLCYLNDNQPEQAIAAFDQSTRIDPEFYRAYLYIADIYAAQDNYKDSLEYLLKAEAGFRDKVEVLFKIGHAYFRIRDFANAKKYLTQVSILFPPADIDRPTQEMLEIIEQHRR